MAAELSSFKRIDFEKRKIEAKRMLEKFPNRVPIIVLRSERSKLPELKQIKFLTPHDLTVGQFLLVIRKRINLLPTQTIFLLAEKKDGNKVTHCLAPTSQPLVVIYEQFKDEDQFLYLTYCEEDPFGAL